MNQAENAAPEQARYRAPETNALLAVLRRLTESVEIVSPELFYFAGEPVPLVPGLPPSLYPTTHPLVTLLRDRLYQRAFVQAFDEPWPKTAPQPLSGFAQQLSQRNASRERWDEGWQIERTLPGGQVLACKHGLQRTLWPGEFVLRDGTAMALRPQAPIGVFQARESHTMQPGFYFAFGETVADQQDEGHLLRLYWNVSGPGVLLLLPRLTGRLNRFGIPFKFKCLNAAEYYVRLDAAVLYVNRRFFRIVRELLDDFLAGLDPQQLGPAVPLFTKALRPGVALAEDPVGGESFGMNRCRVVAEGLWNANCEQAATLDARVERVATQFEIHGLSLERPYVNPGSLFDYA